MHFKEETEHLLPFAAVANMVGVSSDLDEHAAQPQSDPWSKTSVMSGMFRASYRDTVCCMPWRVPLVNIFALREGVEEYGCYPIGGSG